MFKAPFSFEGRIRRLEYGLSYIAYSIAAGAIELLADQDGPLIIMGLLLYIPLGWFILAQGAKRCHDRGNSGWYQIIPFYVLWLIFADGDQYSNEYGPNPKDPNLGLDDLIDEIGDHDEF